MPTKKSKSKDIPKSYEYKEGPGFGNMPKDGKKDNVKKLTWDKKKVDAYYSNKGKKK